jgi:hypothetical protein
VALTQLYVGQIPATAAGRRALRELALDVQDQLRQATQPVPSVALLGFDPAGPGVGERETGACDLVDLLLLRPNALIVAVVWRRPGPILALPGAPWRDAAGGEVLGEAGGLTPLQRAQALRDAVAERLRLADALRAQDARLIGAVVCAPATHPDSQISLDVDDHRQGLKVLGMDELAGVAAMVQSGVALAEADMAAIAAEVFGGRLWLDAGRALFEFAPPRFALRLLDGARAGELVSLPEGQTVVGRRRSPRHYERRVAILGDDLISSDHAVLDYGDGPAVTVRDISKNGTWLAAPGEAERHLRGAERRVGPGALLRMGVTRMRLEQLT